MADNPFADRPAITGKQKNQCPPDMPKGDSEADKAARQKFWIERGNANLAAAGQHHLQWVCLGGYYTIEDRY